MASRTSELTLRLIDDISKPARSVEQALKQAETQIREVASAMASDGVPASDRLVASIVKLGATKEDIATVSAAWRDYTRSSSLAAESADWTKDQASAVRSWETQTIGSVRAVMRERQAETSAMR
jgi:hypothetical protein